MKKAVNFVDDEMLDRSTKWLIGRRKKDQQEKFVGKFAMSSEHIDTFGSATQDITDAYIVWVLTQENKFSKEDL